MGQDDVYRVLKEAKESLTTEKIAAILGHNRASVDRHCHLLCDKWDAIDSMRIRGKMHWCIKPKRQGDERGGKMNCMFWRRGHCNSDYAKGLICEGGGNKPLPEGCPYSFDKLKEMKAQKARKETKK